MEVNLIAKQKDEVFDINIEFDIIMLKHISDGCNVIKTLGQAYLIDEYGWINEAHNKVLLKLESFKHGNTN